ncbi:MAG: hypothetical protein HY716_02820 [Planctomycetes bacterium]|nr:hypothetical protein [Planctomycetota bacterium]
MRKEFLFVVVGVAAFIGGAYYVIRQLGAPAVDMVGFEQIRLGDPLSAVDERFPMGVRVCSSKLDAKDAGFVSEFEDAESAGAIRLHVHRSGNMLLFFGVDRHDKVAWKGSRSE